VSTSSITGTAVRDLAATITRQLDADKDGKLSSTEFEGFLSQFLTMVQTTSTGSSTPAAAATAATAAATAARPAAATPRPAIGTMAGFDPVKLANSSHNTFKYEIGRILQGYANTPEGLREALPEIQTIAPNAKIIGSKGDKVDFGDYTDKNGERIGVIDILQAAGLGGRAWQWLPVE
jgi:hypothetical protein